MKLSQQNTRHDDLEEDNDSGIYGEPDAESYNDLFGVDKYQSDWTTRMLKFVIGILLLIFSIVWSFKTLL